MNRLTQTSRVLSMLAAFAGLSMSVTAATFEPAGGQSPLSGPRVKDNAPPGNDRNFDGTKPKARSYRASEIPQPMYMRVVRETLGSTDKAEIKLTSEQDTLITKLDSDFGDTVKAFRTTYGKEMAGLRQKLGGGPDGPSGTGGPGGPGGKGAPGKRPGGKGGPGGPDGGPKGPPPDGDANGGPGMHADAPKLTDDERTKLEARAQELRDKAPKAEDVQKAIWALLTVSQQEAAKPKLDAVIQEAKDRQMERYKQNEIKKEQRKNSGGGTDGAQPPKNPKGKGRPAGPPPAGEPK